MRAPAIGCAGGSNVTELTRRLPLRDGSGGVFVTFSAVIVCPHRPVPAAAPVRADPCTTRTL